MLGPIVAVISVWILFKTQLDIFEGMVRCLTDILWSGSRRVRAWRGGDVRLVYHAIMAVLVLWGVFALSLTQPLVLLQLGANMAGVVMVLAPLHLLRVNTTSCRIPFVPRSGGAWCSWRCRSSTAASSGSGSWAASGPTPSAASSSSCPASWASELDDPGAPVP